MKLLRVLFVVFFAAMNSSVMALMVEVSEAEIARQSEVVVVAQVVKKSVTTNIEIRSHEDIFFDVDRNGDFAASIVTEYSLQVVEPLKGNVPERTITVRSPGGEDFESGIGQWVSDYPYFKVGDQAIIYLDRNAKQAYRWAFLELGVTRLNKETGTALAKMLNREKINRAKDLIAGRTPVSKKAFFAAPVAPTVDSIAYQVGSGVGFNTGEKVWIIGTNFQHEGSPADTLELYGPKTELLWDGDYQNGLITYWNTGLLWEPSGGDDQASSALPVIRKVADGQAVTSSFTTGAVLHFDFNYGEETLEDDEIYFIYDFTNLDLPGDETEQDAEDALDSAIATWNDSCGADLGQTTGGGNYITWSTGSSSGWAGTSLSYSLQTGEITGADIYFYEGNHDFSTDPDSGEGDIESIALHEIGHTLRLDHLRGTYDQNKVMYYAYSAGTTKRSLHAGDVRGARWIYGP